MRLSGLLLLSAVLAMPAPAGDTRPDYVNPKSLTEIIDRYVAAQNTQREAMRGARMEVAIDARLPTLEKKGTLKVLRKISTLGQISFQQLGQFIGDPIVRKEVIARYLSLEAEERYTSAMAITPANYNFQIKAVITRQPQQTYIFELTPKKKAPGLFRGELWLDGSTGMPLKETGQLVKNPSKWLKSVRFVRDYEFRRGLAVLKHVESTVDVRLFGKAELKADYSEPTWEDNDQAVASASSP